jgi:DNA-directed RNA polymerase subunit K/omega
MEENNIPITKYEKVRILGARATQLANGAKPMTDIGNLTDPLKIAQKEFKEGVLPICIMRTLPNGEKIQVSLVKTDIL